MFIHGRIEGAHYTVISLHCREDYVTLHLKYEVSLLHSNINHTVLHQAGDNKLDRFTVKPVQPYWCNPFSCDLLLSVLSRVKESQQHSSGRSCNMCGLSPSHCKFGFKLKREWDQGLTITIQLGFVLGKKTYYNFHTAWNLKNQLVIFLFFFIIPLFLMAICLKLLISLCLASDTWIAVKKYLATCSKMHALFQPWSA